jgi:AcrR family transcriptional regulator
MSDEHIHRLSSAGQLEDLGAVYVRVLDERNALERERDEARTKVAEMTQRLDTAQAWISSLMAVSDEMERDLRAIAAMLGTTDTTNLADRVRARLAGQETQTEHVVRESARRMFEAHVAHPDEDIDSESERARDLVCYFLNMARVFAETERAEDTKR